MKISSMARVGGTRARQSLATVAACVMGLPTAALAQLPQLEEPSQGGGGLMSTLQGYLYDFGALIGLILCAVAFLIVGASAIASFKEARERETWGKFTVTVVVGVVLIVAIIWLATEAAPILSQ
ncbi:TIGR03745 family integrating conjugative element membrane protein [Vreelandella olivaria]|uniref:TIGR03745 family integrating conjugative element membrane protein n=1 Tax=Vreelandella olivaria TaxID=390919 RepID=UPI00201FA2DC|nr:TIGR03745 family integrating conjugative element membrane protein [Halomonas olivaria]